jgi:hypothetical protein
MEFGRIDLDKTTYNITLNAHLLNPVAIKEINRVYAEYCLYKKFKSVIPMIAGRFAIPNTETFGYFEQDQLIAWSMYRIWDDKNIVADHHAWNYRNPQLRMGIRSLQNECAIYRNRGYQYMYFESIEPYMYNLQGFEILGSL